MPCIATRSRPLVLRGTLTTFRRRCGKAACRCATGEPHESPALTFTEGGRTKTITLTAAEVRRGRSRSGPLRGRQGRAGGPGGSGSGPAARPTPGRRGHDGASSVSAEQDPFDRSRACFAELVGWLEGSEAAASSHAELEDELDRRGRELLRQMVQGQLELRALRERRADEVKDADDVRHGAVETGHTRPLTTIFGAVSVTRLAYRRRGHANLYPGDGRLNLPPEQHSHGLRRLAAVEGSRGSFEEATAAIGRTTGQQLGKRQVETLAARAAIDVEDFYATRRPPPGGHEMRTTMRTTMCTTMSRHLRRRQGDRHAPRGAAPADGPQGPGRDHQAQDPPVERRKTQPQAPRRGRRRLRPRARPETRHRRDGRREDRPEDRAAPAPTAPRTSGSPPASSTTPHRC